jgi:hypothetical protein
MDALLPLLVLAMAAALLSWVDAWLATGPGRRS